MKTKLLLLISQLALYSCLSPDSQTEKQQSSLTEATTDSLRTEAADTVGQAPYSAENNEYMEWRDIRINGKYPLATSVKNIEGITGKADSVVSIDWNSTCFSGYRSEDSRNAYFGGIQFEQFGDSLAFHLINFSKDHNVYLQHKDLRLDHSTTLNDIKKHFPAAVKDISRSYYLINGKETDAVNLPASKELSEGQWILMFQNNKLIRIDYGLPC